MIDKLKDALGYISEKHIAEAAAVKKHRKPYWLGAVAAVLAVILVVNVILPLSVEVKAVSTARYPATQESFQGLARQEQMAAARAALRDYFTDSLRLTLSDSGSENQVYSPLNLYMALAVTAELCDGDSRAQILDMANADSVQSLREQATQIWHATYNNDSNSKCLLANSLWLDKELNYDQATMDALATLYYTSVYSSDLGSDASNQAIRDWLNEQTGGLLEEQVQNAGIQEAPGTFPVFGLYSTVYFRSKWSQQFAPDLSRRAIFHSATGDKNELFMNKKKTASFYHWGEDFGAVTEPLNNGCAMWFILPDEDKTVDDVLASGEYLDMILNSNAYWESGYHVKKMLVNLSVPKFDITATGDLKEAAQKLGVTDIFDAQTADFSTAVTGEHPVWISGINQATRVAIDEEGVTAASYVEMVAPGAAEPPTEIIDFILDRPFLFVITNRYAIPVFAGVVNDP